MPKPGKTIGEMLFEPRSIAVIGASNDPTKISGRPVDYLLTLGFKGAVYPVNPRRSVVQGLTSFPNLAAICSPVDLAIIVVPAMLVPEAVRDCADAGVGTAVIFGSGFAEAGGTGCELQAEIDAVVAHSPIRLLGPNCLGSFALPTRAFATFSSAFDEADKISDEPIALVSQSGAVGTFLYSSFAALGGGVRYFANSGNEADLTVPELLLDLARRDDVHILAGHLEGVRRPDILRDAAATALDTDKPLILIKAGRTPAGGRAVAAHTASEAGDDAEFDDLARAASIIRVSGMEAAVDALLAFRPRRRAAGRRVTIVTLSGGAGALAVDAAIDLGLEIQTWQPRDRESLERIIPSFGSALNPIDVTGALLTEPTMMDGVLAEVVNHTGTDAVVVVLGNADRGSEEIVSGLLRAHRATKKPFVVAWTGGNGKARERLLAAGVPTYTDPARAACALAQVVRFSDYRRARSALRS